jgi:hypothetical protein
MAQQHPGIRFFLFLSSPDASYSLRDAARQHIHNPGRKNLRERQ